VSLQADLDSTLRERAAKFKMMLSARFKWTFEEEEEDDEMPVVVDLGGAGM
jgi:hypothetical protein